MRDAVGGCSSLTVGHFGKDLDKGERGSSSFRANYDTILWVEKHAKDEPTGIHTVQLWVRKMKDGEDGKRVWLQSKVIQLPDDGDDTGRTSLVLVPVSEEIGRDALMTAGQIVKQQEKADFANEVERALLQLTQRDGLVSNDELVMYFVNRDKPSNASDEDVKKLKNKIQQKIKRAGERGELTRYSFNGRWGLPLGMRTSEIANSLEGIVADSPLTRQ